MTATATQKARRGAARPSLLQRLAGRGPDPRTPWGRLPIRARALWAGIDGLALLILLGLVAAVLYPVYGSPWLFVCVLGFGLVGLVIALVSAVRRWRVGVTALVAVAAWFGLGSLLVMPSAALGWVLPTGRTLYGLLTGPVTAWRDMLTLDPPIGETVNLYAVPGLLGLAAGLAGGVVALRSRRPMLAWLPVAVAYVVAAALGSAVAFRPLLLGVTFFLVVLLWTSYRRAHLRESLAGRANRPRLVRAGLGVVTLAVAGALVWAALPVLSPDTPRASVREAVEPPLDLEKYASPLQGFRANITKQEQTAVFEVTGLGKGDILRLATMDTYDGLSFRVATTDDAAAVGETTFTRVGEWIADDTDGAPGQATVRVMSYDGVWVPNIGRTTKIDFDGERAVSLAENFFYNRSSGTGLTPVGLRQGDVYALELVLPARPSDDEIKNAAAGTAVMPRDDGVPDELRNRAHEWADSYPTAGAQALALEAQLRQGWFSHGQNDEVRSASGHSQARLVTLLQEPERMVGDGEQYAVAMTLMARELGIPARVVYGYRGNGTASVLGKDVGAWAELNLKDLGWVMFDPTPPEDRVLNEEEAPQPPTPKPHIENPPPPPQRPEDPPPDDELPIDPGEPPVEEQRIDWAQIGAWVALGGIPLLTIVVPITLIVGLKLRRRSRRRNNPDMAARVSGAWSELVDRARDLGRSPSISATRSEQAEQMVEDFAKIRLKADPIAVSREADWIVFAPGDPSEGTSREFWQTSKNVEKGMKRSVGWPRWLASKLSTKSFRRMR